MTNNSSATLGQSIPTDTSHAVSVSLPTWQANVGYEEGQEWVVGRMTTGYPRFFIHKSIQAFAAAIVQRHGSPSEQAYLFPSPACATRCVHFLRTQSARDSLSARVIDLYPNDADRPTVSAVLLAQDLAKLAKAFWQHTGEGISSRRAEYCLKAFIDGSLSAKAVQQPPEEVPEDKLLHKGPRRYQKNASTDTTVPSLDSNAPNVTDAKDLVHFVEERFGRNLDLTLAENAKMAIRKRIAGALGVNSDGFTQACNPLGSTSKVRETSEGDVFLFSCGMNSIFYAHQMMMVCRGLLKSVSYGFPYIDTLKILEKFGPGCVFYGYGSQDEIDNLETRCQNGDRWLALFCEFPGNPLLKTPDLRRLHCLADRYDFALIVDETIGNFINVNVLPFADIVVSSLTKVFTGECNVMGGSLVLNPHGRYYDRLKAAASQGYEDNYWPEDAIFMERNSRDFVTRIDRINKNAEAVCEILLASPIVKEVYYPKHSPSRPYYDQFRNPDGGYGGLLSVTFKQTGQAIAFFDHIKTQKGPSLGTNFTLSSPYVLLAHYGELEWARKFGVDADLIRMSIGLEETGDLVFRVKEGLQTARSMN